MNNQDAEFPMGTRVIYTPAGVRPNVIPDTWPTLVVISPLINDGPEELLWIATIHTDINQGNPDISLELPGDLSLDPR